jgi:hypothetical protein
LGLFSSCISLYQLQDDHIPYQLGDQEIQIRRVMSADSGFVFINLHEDENTSVKAGKKFLKRHPGTMYSLEHGRTRRIYFQIQGSTYHFDPNRMFTEEGIRRTLKGPEDHIMEARVMVLDFGKYVFQQLKIDQLDKIIALHNNGADEYSLRSYMPAGQYKNEAAAVHQNLTIDHDDFYFTTDSVIYEQLKARNWNVILQNNQSADDDGSLSVYLKDANVSYVNVEAQHKHKRVQLQMYLVLDSLFQLNDESADGS